MIRKIIFLTALVSGLVGCSTPHDFFLSSTTGQIPEVSGRLWGGSAGLNFANAASVEVVRDFTTTPPSTDNATISGMPFAGLQLPLSLGVSQSLEVYLTDGLGLRWQYLGKAREIGMKGTLFAGGFSPTFTSEATNNGSNFKAESTSRGGEIGTSFGYTPNLGNTLYVTVADRFGKADTTVTKDFVPQAQYDDKFNEVLITAGARTGNEWYFQYEISLACVHWDRLTDACVGGTNLGFGYQW